MKRIITLLTALSLFLTLTACTEQPEQLTISDLREPEAETVKMTYTAKQLPVTMDSSQENVVTFGNLIFWEEGEVDRYYECYDLAAECTVENPFPVFSNTDETKRFQPINLYVQDNTLCLIYSESVLDERENWESSRFVQMIYDEHLNQLEETVLYETDDAEKCYSPYVKNPDGTYFASFWNDSYQQIHLLDPEMQEMGRVNAMTLFVEEMFPAEDGSVYVSYSEELGGLYVQLGVMNTETMTLETPQIADLPESLIHIFAGNERYDVFVMDRDGIHGISDNTCTEVVNFQKINFNGNYAQNAAALPDGNFLLGIQNSGGEETEYWVLTETEAPDKEPEIIRFATLYGGMEDEVNAFNRAHTDYRIEMVDYMQYIENGDTDAAVEQFQTDMLAGDTADIIDTNALPVANYSKKDLFEDLNPWMEQDESFNPDDYFMNYFEALEYDQKLYQIGFRYSVETLLAKTEFVGADEGRTFTEFAEIAQNLPDGMELFTDMYDRTILFNLYAGNLDCFVDMEQAMCNFNTPEFVSLLELCRNYEDYETRAANQKLMSEDTLNELLKRNDLAYREDTALFDLLYIDEPYQLHHKIAGEFGGADVTLIGMPTAAGEGNGGAFTTWTYCMSSQSEYKEQVWEFFRSLLEEDYQSDMPTNGLPVHRGAMDRMIEAAMQPAMEAADGMYDPLRCWHDPQENRLVPIGNATQEEMDRLIAYIEGITRTSSSDPKILTIFWEEMDMYLAGDQNAQKAAEMIQSRVSIYLSEQS